MEVMLDKTGWGENWYQMGVPDRSTRALETIGTLGTWELQISVHSGYVLQALYVNIYIDW